MAATLLVTTKLIVGLLTNSLGILSEALHSGIDLIAAVMTLYAVKVSARPPDAEHMYGYEKIESLSSLGETILLFITCVWITYEAIERLFLHRVEVDVGIWAVLVMIMTFTVDFSRSRALHRAAVNYKSQALEADAIHFSTDLISSATVLIGILLTMAGFNSFDSLGALGVAFITAVIGYRLWKKSTHTLLDVAPQGISDRIVEEAANIPEIQKINGIRVRESGPITYIEAIVLIDQTIPLEQAHRIVDVLEGRIKDIVPGADVLIHAEPGCLVSALLEDRIRGEAAKIPEVRGIHNINITDERAARIVDFHVEVDGDLTVEKAFYISSQLEKKVRDLDRCIVKVVSKIEPVGRFPCPGEDAPQAMEGLMEVIGRVTAVTPEIVSCSNTMVHRTLSGLKVSLTCNLNPYISVREAYEIINRLESQIRSHRPDIESVTIHLEPANKTPT